MWPTTLLSKPGPGCRETTLSGLPSVPTPPFVQGRQRQGSGGCGGGEGGGGGSGKAGAWWGERCEAVKGEWGGGGGGGEGF